MHENGIVAEVRERLQEAGLIPPVKGLTWQGSEDEDDPQEESVLIDVTAPLTRELEAQLSEVLNGLAYEVRSVPPDHGVVYGSGPDRRPTP